MPLRDADGEGELAPSPIICAICVEPLEENGGRSYAKLQCRHQFHLDCIGSAFNFKGVMQCPCCRNIEKGLWLTGPNSHSSSSESSLVDSLGEEDFSDVSYSGPFGAHRQGPSSGVTHFPHHLSADPFFIDHNWNYMIGLSNNAHSRAFFSGYADSAYPAAVRTSRGDSDAAQRSGSFSRPFVHNCGYGIRFTSSVAASTMTPHPTAHHDHVEDLDPFRHLPRSLPSDIWSRLYSNIRNPDGSVSYFGSGTPTSFSEYARDVYALPLPGSSGRNIHGAVYPVQNHF